MLFSILLLYIKCLPRRPVVFIGYPVVELLLCSHPSSLCSSPTVLLALSRTFRTYCWAFTVAGSSPWHTLLPDSHMARFLSSSVCHLFVRTFLDAALPLPFSTFSLLCLWWSRFSHFCVFWLVSLIYKLRGEGFLSVLFTSVSLVSEPCLAHSMHLLNIFKWMNLWVNKWLSWRVDTFLKILTHIAKLTPAMVFLVLCQPEMHKSTCFPTVFTVGGSFPPRHPPWWGRLALS